MLKVKQLSVRYPNGKLALADFDLAVNAGELVIVLGGNGSGKTTLLRCIARTLSPTRGEVWVNGTNVTHLDGEALRRTRSELAMISQRTSLVRRRSVLANVATGALGRHHNVWTAFGAFPVEELRLARKKSCACCAVLPPRNISPCSASCTRSTWHLSTPIASSGSERAAPPSTFPAAASRGTTCIVST